MNSILWFAVAAAGGYVASVFTWPKLREWFRGVEAEIKQLEQKLKALRDK